MVDATAIQRLYPELEPLVDYEVRDDGLGPYIAKWPDNTPHPTQEQLDAAMLPMEGEQREQFKTARADAVAAIRVTTAAGNTYDGDEISQGRMARAILGLQAAGADAVVSWVLADNSVIQVSAIELLEALTLSGVEQARLWVYQP